MAEEKKLDSETPIREVVNGLRRSPHWQEFRRRIVEYRMNECVAQIVKPVKDQEGIYEAERTKGAFIALGALLQLFDSTLPDSAKENEDE